MSKKLTTLAALLFMAFAVNAYASVGYVTPNGKKGVNIRKDASTTSPIVMKLKAGQKVKVLAENIAGSKKGKNAIFYKVETTNGEGYVWKNAVGDADKKQPTQIKRKKVAKVMKPKVTPEETPAVSEKPVDDTTDDIDTTGEEEY